MLEHTIVLASACTNTCSVNLSNCIYNQMFYLWNMSILKIKLLIIMLLMLCFAPFVKVHAQYYILGQDPASIKWKQIKTEHFNIIYPDNFYSGAQEYANLLELSYKYINQPYINKNKTLKVVLHNRSAYSNAMVSPTPFHADFFTLWDQHTYAQTWPKQLTLHEYRHAVQMQKLNQGTTKVLKVLFGDQAIGAVMGVFLPFWFLEGDAVYSETIFSHSGRGRAPDFTMDIKAQVLDKRIYSYDKALYGSYIDYVPNYYTLGYELVVSGLLQYPEMWNNMLNNVAQRPFTLVPFTKSIKESCGVGKVGFYKNTLKKRKKDWAKELPTQNDNSKMLPVKPKFYTNYRFACPLNDGSFIIHKSGMDDISRFVVVDKYGNEDIVFTPGYDFNESLSVSGDLICWNERTYDPRWSNRTYSVIKIRNLKTKQTKLLTRKTRLFAPVLSNDGKKVAAVEQTEEGDNSIVILNVADGSQLNKFKTPDNLFFMNPSWSDDDSQIVATVLGDNGKSIILIDVDNQSYNFVLPFGFTDISRPAIHENEIIYTAAYTGINNIYCLNLSSGVSRKVTNTNFDATDARFFANADSVAFSEYTANGYRTSIMLLDIENSDIANVNIEYKYLIDSLKPPGNFILDDDTIPNVEYSGKSYSRLGHLFNIHSWGLAAVDLNNYEFQPGVNILTQNILSTSYGTLGYYYDPNEKTGKTKLSFTYAGWYPEIQIEGDYGMKRTHFYDDDTVIQELKYNEANMSLNMSVPLNLTRSKWIKGAEPYVGIGQKFLNVINNDTIAFKEDEFTSIAYGLYGYIQLKRSAKDIYPRLGISLNTVYKHTPFADDNNSIFGITSTIYLPVDKKGHSGLRIYLGYQNKTPYNYEYSNVVSTPRGYSGIELKDMFSAKIDLAFPVAYPDWDIPAVAYLKRITGRFFTDYCYGTDFYNENQYYSSIGVELYTDWHFLSLIPEVQLGTRAAYDIDYNLNIEFLFGFSIN